MALAILATTVVSRAAPAKSSKKAGGESEVSELLSQPSSEFQKLCRDLKEIGDSVRIDASADRITLSVEGDAMVGRATATLKDGVNIEEGGKSTSSSYGARYLAAFSRGASLCSTVQIQMSADTPLQMTFGCDGEQLTLFLAARISD